MLPIEPRKGTFVVFEQQEQQLVKRTMITLQEMAVFNSLYGYCSTGRPGDLFEHLVDN